LKNISQFSKNASLFLEYLWLVIAIVSLFASIYHMYFNGLKDTWALIAMTIIAGIMYAFRRHLRIKLAAKPESDSK